MCNRRDIKRRDAKRPIFPADPPYPRSHRLTNSDQSGHGDSRGAACFRWSATKASCSLSLGSMSITVLKFGRFENVSAGYRRRHRHHHCYAPPLG